jgi:hypothetical protein
VDLEYLIPRFACSGSSTPARPPAERDIADGLFVLADHLGDPPATAKPSPHG